MPLRPATARRRFPIPQQDGVTDGNSLAPKGDVAGSDEERVLTSTGWSAQVQYLADEGSTGHSNDRPLLLDQQKAEQPGPEDEQGPAQLRGPEA
jgi:hypothetical protein